MRKLCVTLLFVGGLAMAQTSATLIEPGAGAWKTWVISSGRDFRVPPPPDAAGSQAEIAWLKDYISQNAAQGATQIKHWDAGAPGYRWLDLMISRFIANQPLPNPPRSMLYVSLAMYDATIAAWGSKYAYNRLRPSQVDASVPTALAVPRSPSYPSEHAATAAAAAAVLGYLYPAEAQSFELLAEEAGRSRLLAGLEYPSDYTAGLALGRRVAAEVTAKARADGSDAVWGGTVPTGPCMWTGTNPGNVTAVGWKTLLLTSANEFRPPAPPACTSAQVQAEVGAVLNYPRSFVSNYKAFYWQTPEGTQMWPYVWAHRWLAEDKLDQNPPRAHRVYALLAASHWDTFIASQDGKFAYWYLRPHQLEPRIVPLFPVPNFPSYPSNHSSFSSSRAEILSYLFPTRAEVARSIGKEAGDSRIWAGIHYEMDNQSGVTLGKAVAQKFITWADADGSK